MSSTKWGIQNRQGEVMFDTLSESADTAIKIVCDRIDAYLYEDLLTLGFRLVRVEVVVTVKESI